MAAVQTVDHRVQSSEHPWLKLFMRERRPAEGRFAQLRGVILFVHGSFQPGCGFDCSAPGYSWIAYLAERGFAAFYLDLRGYGRSGKPTRQWIEQNGDTPFCTAEQASRDIADAVEAICQHTGRKRIGLVGFSWGTLTTPMYAAAHGERVEKLMLVAPCAPGGAMAVTPEAPDSPDPGGQIFVRGFDVLRDPRDPAKFNPAVGAFTRWSIADTRRHDSAAMRGLDPALYRVDEIATTSIGDLREATGAAGDIVEGPSGAPLNLFQYYVQGREFYDPAAISMPTMMVRGDRDFAGTLVGAQSVFESLGATEKHFLTVANAGHGVFRQKPARRVFAISEAFFQ
jgi:pimeloyl-ACP methyl ester carboxylesterase